MPSLMSDHKYLNNKASGRSLGCFPFESNWRSALLKTERIKKEYSSTFDLRDCEESAAVPNLTQGVQSYQENPSPILQMKKGFAYGAAKPFPTGSYSEDEHNCVPTSYILPQTSSQYLGYEFCKNRGDITVVDLQKRGLDSWNPSPLKMPAIHDGGGEIGALRSKKNNHISSICSLPAGPRYKFEATWHSQGFMKCFVAVDFTESSHYPHFAHGETATEAVTVRAGIRTEVTGC
ncbi:putative uncharacterized protein C8orf89 homolog isoform X4 [Malaclemys terrapin pileata]|nr:putative uncharacterized protein C8orf89 homolog isoform X4 [Malaclemys terrapin pileata]